MNLNNLLNENSKHFIMVSLDDLKAIVKEVMEDTKRELVNLVIAQKSETYISRQRASEMLDVDLTTLWRWAKQGYLVPVCVGGKKRYKMTDINQLLNNR